MKIRKTAEKTDCSIEINLGNFCKNKERERFYSVYKDEANCKRAIKQKEKYKNDLQSSNNNTSATTMAREISDVHLGFISFCSILYHGSDYWMRSG